MTERPDFSILLLTYNQPKFISERLDEIAAHCHDPSLEVLVLDNGGTRGPAQLVFARHVGQHPYLFASYRVDPNVGFGPGFNWLAEKAVGKWLVFLSDDVEIGGDFLSPLRKVFETTPRCLIGHRLIDWRAGWNEFGGRMLPYLEGYFLALSRDLWSEMGGFDPLYAPHDYEDVDLSYAATQKEIPLLPLHSLPLRHLGAGTIGQSPVRHNLTTEKRAAFAAKWGLPNEPERP